jgi:hypothetical protein
MNMSAITGSSLEIATLEEPLLYNVSANASQRDSAAS